MKDELIDTINKKAEQNRYLINVSASFTTRINGLITSLLRFVKYPGNVNLKEATLMKNFFQI